MDILQQIEALRQSLVGKDWFESDFAGWEGKLIEALKAIAEPPVVTDMTAIPGEILDSLNCGDRIVKKTGNQKHLYLVSYKGEGVDEGICLTYTDASVIETVSYDLTDEGWAYNSTDKWEKA